MKKLLATLFLLSASAAVQAAGQGGDPAQFPATPADELGPGESDCRQRAEQLGRAGDPEFIRVTFDTPVGSAAADGPVGSQAIARVYKGSAVYQARPGSERRQFICLHTGDSGGVVFFDYLPVSVEVPDLTRHNQYETWQCRQRGVFRVTYNSVRDQVYLRVDGREQALRHAVSASGSRYDNDELAWWGKGREARLLARADGQERLLDTCRLTDIRKP